MGVSRLIFLMKGTPVDGCPLATYIMARLTDKFGKVGDFAKIPAIIKKLDDVVAVIKSRVTAGKVLNAPGPGVVSGGKLSINAPNGTGAQLLPGESLVGTYDELIDAGMKGDNITPHHIPSANHMKQHGVSKGDGIAINMEHPHPGAGGRHRQTFTYGTQADETLSPRDALGRGVRDAKRIYEEAGLYGPEIRNALQDLIDQNRKAHEGLFDK